jgi:(5-formylfuran-3-yl)methyl phosphate synthase
MMIDFRNAFNAQQLLFETQHGVMISRVDNLILPFQVGILEKEQGVRQRLRFNVRVASRETGRVGENLQKTFDYRLIIETLDIISKARHVPLLEEIAEEVAGVVLCHPLSLGMWIRIEKLDLLSNCESFGIERVFIQH